ncbi:hypothetical protein GGTG_07746 [Gaeumannomyces tritici R3-111a-1]|uniref:Uncharacterized protein n=1 Tax=Gaeumannomyces tritici (strain R3-111a-1) TaxID=644352 RepID=J3P2K0_GAET3|nr:hypothetical protein GGTG_07746 [Gaeumannomyces tritici R3-111a-1]EJT73892.1 hypothetical protein GGTG_07746 [Gaeumannomyces tritici R3-111a-1]
MLLLLEGTGPLFSQRPTAPRWLPGLLAGGDRDAQLFCKRAAPPGDDGDGGPHLDVALSRAQGERGLYEGIEIEQS